MDQTVERGENGNDVGLDSGLEALRRSPDFRGPIEPVDDHEHSNDHFALIYESRGEQFATAVPFVRQGLERNERCLYIADENSREAVLATMRDRGIDVDEALDSGALSVVTREDAYLRGGTFRPDDMIGFLDDAITAASEEYDGLRVTGEMTWAFSDESDVEDLVEYEAELNGLFPDANALILCQYNRERFPSDVVRDVVRTHPHLIHDNVVSRNVYYTPPEKFLGPERPSNEVDRMMETLRERTEAKAGLEEHQRFLREHNEITASPDRTFEEKLQALFELGCERFDLELGAMARVDVEDDWFEVEYVSDDHDHFEPGLELPLSETYCTAATEIKAAGSVSDPHEEGFDDVTVYREFGVRAYLGTYVEVTGGSDRTFFFVSSEPKEGGFSTDELAFQRMLGRWVKYELERSRRERFLRESYEITSDPALSFEAKLDRLLRLGCERFDLEMAGLNYLPSWDGAFRLEKGVGLGVDEEEKPLWTDPGEGCFCRRTMTEDAPVGRVDVRGTDWADDSIHEQFGLTSYLGTKVTGGSTPYGTLWFGSTEPRERPFSDAERTFIELMGQWVSYEIERREHSRSQRELYEIAADSDGTFEEKLEAIFELGRERFDLELGGIARIDPDTDLFEVEAISGDHEYLVPGEQYPLSETYCRLVTEDGEIAGVTDPVDQGFDDEICYEQFGVRAYLGTYLRIDGDDDRTFFFLSNQPREERFTAADRTFHHLMGQWAQYELERRQNERALEETVSRLQQSNDRLKQFAYAASHDLQEPLRMVSSYLQLLESRYGDDLDENAREYIDFAVDGADRMRTMVDDLLAFLRVEQSDGEFGPVECDALLEQVTDNLQMRIERSDAVITVDSLPTAVGNREQLEQLFTDLVANAVKYNESDTPRVEISATRRDECWEFSVRDNGIGIDPDRHDRIFEVFKRLHHDDEYAGTGIGLSLCQEIVENHGGEIRVESRPGEGSTFSFTLPRERR